MENYVVVNGKRYRKGYTTGACAAAASKAAVVMLLSGKVLECIEIDTPAGIRLSLTVVDTQISENSAKCAIVKDGGDDPDVTTGLKIFSEVKLINESVINICAGEGVGVVTLPGLKVEVGKPAINPVPKKMIEKELKEVLPQGMGADVFITVPGGEATAAKTYNPRLGIVGGISILGTTGIVQPMSEEAWKDTLALELGMMAARGSKKAVFIFGNYGENFATSKLGINNHSLIKISNFVGFMLDNAVEYGFEKIVMVGHLGKLIKVAAGIFNTHSRIADARMETLAAYAALEGASRPIVTEIYECRTSEAAAKIINNNKLTDVYRRVVSNVSKRCNDYTFNKIKFGTVLFDLEDKILSFDEEAKQILKELGSTYEL